MPRAWGALGFLFPYRLLKPDKSHRADGFTRFGRHELIQLGVPGEAVFEGDDIAGAANQPATCGHIGDVPELGVGNMQQLRQFRAIRRTLVEHHQKFRVCQHHARGFRMQQFLYVLRQTRHEAVVLANAFPQAVKEITAVRIAEEKVELVCKHPGGLAPFPVLDDPVENRIERDQHPDGHQLLAQFPDIVGYHNPSGFCRSK